MSQDEAPPLAEALQALRDYYCDFDGTRDYHHLAVETVLAEFDRMRTELDQRVAWELYREDCHREDEECYFHSAANAQEFLDRDYVIPNSTDSDIIALSAEAYRWVETGTGLAPRDRPLVLEPPTFPDPASHD